MDLQYPEEAGSVVWYRDGLLKYIYAISSCIYKM